MKPHILIPALMVGSFALGRYTAIQDGPAISINRPAAPAAPPVATVPTTPSSPTPNNSEADKNARLCKAQGRASVVTVLTDKGLGSGNVVGPNLILTNHHVIEGSENVKIVLRGNMPEDPKEAMQPGSKVPSLPGKVIADDDKADMALIKVESPQQLPMLKMADKSPPIGSPVIAIGSPKGVEGVITEGQFGGQFGAPTDVKHSARLDHGNSGGSLLTPFECRLIGLNKGVMSDDQSISIATSIETVAPFVKKYSGQ